MRAGPSAASLSGLCSVAMRETLYAEVDLTDAVVDLVKPGHYPGVSVAIFGPTYPSNPKPGHHYLPNRRDRNGIALVICKANSFPPQSFSEKLLSCQCQFAVVTHREKKLQNDSQRRD